MTVKAKILAALKVVVAAKGEADPDYLYHITYYKYLEGIASSGLQPGSGGSIGQGAGNNHHSKGKVFLTEKEGGISFWYSTALKWADHNSDDVLEDELIPIVLRVARPFDAYELAEDPIGTRDSSYDAYTTKDSIKPSDLELWDGTAWVSLDQGVDPEIAIEVEEYEEDGETHQYNYIKSDNPLEPK